MRAHMAVRTSRGRGHGAENDVPLCFAGCAGPKMSPFSGIWGVAQLLPYRSEPVPRRKLVIPNVSGLGRFSSPDPIAGSTSDPQSLNRYSYVRNMPVMLSDPSGMRPNCDTVEKRDSNQQQDSKTGGPSALADDSDAANPPEPQGGCPGSHVNPWGGGGDGVSLDWGFASDDSGLGVGDPIFGGAVIFGWERLGTENDSAWQWVWALLSQAPDLGQPPLGGGLLPLPMGQPAPPPGYEECKAALSNAGATFAGLQRALDNWSTLKDAAWNAGIPPQILAALGIHESDFLNRSQLGGGLGRGIFQIDIGQNPAAATIAGDTVQSAQWAANQVGDRFRHFAGLGYDLGLSMGGALHDYNASRADTRVLVDLARHTDNFAYLNLGTTIPAGSNSQFGGYVTNILQIAAFCF